MEISPSPASVRCMKRLSPRGFTLVEMLVVMAVIAILTGLVLSVSGYVQNTAARKQALGEIAEMSQGCESFRADFGSYPQDKDSDALEPKKDGNPVSGESGDRYHKACLTLYKALSGDTEPEDKPDNIPELKTYVQLPQKRLRFTKDDNTGRIKEVKFIQDPFGNCYGYSTIGLKAEQDYKDKLEKNPVEQRPTDNKGYSPTFDMWSTGGQTNIDLAGKWITSWGN